MFQEVKLNEGFDKYHCKDAYGRKSILDKLSRINIFIGTNNSGKSRLLRKLFSGNGYSLLPNNINPEELRLVTENFITNLVNGSIRGLPEPQRSMVVKHMQSVIDELAYWPINITANHNLFEAYRQKVDQNQLSSALAKMGISDAHGVFVRIKNCISQHLNLFTDKISRNLSPHEINRVYVPILRSLKGLVPKAEIGINSYNDLYKDHTIEEYFKSNQKSAALKIFTGLTMYEDVTRLLLGNTASRNKIKQFEQFLEDAFFESEVNIVPHLESRTLHIKIGEKEHAIHNLGDGIQAIILLTYPLFMNQGEKIVFYFEEPETHLHPGYQRLFLETLLDKRFKSYQYFMTTHSNHFLDITLDYDKISVYSFHRHKDEDEFDVENVTSVDDNVLKLIGARTSSVFLSNCTIWVEGITDRIYIRKFLEVIQESKPVKFREDYHFSFVEYAGNNITHWSFLDSEDQDHPNINVDRLCSKLFLITDNDGAGFTLKGQPNIAKPKKYERHQKLYKKLGDRYYLLKCREIENLLRKETIEQVIRRNEPKNDALDFKRFHKADHTDVQLGKFIEEKVIGLKKKYRYKGADALSRKPEFAKIAVEHIKTIDDLSPEAKKLAEKLYAFISNNNT